MEEALRMKKEHNKAVQALSDRVNSDPTVGETVEFAKPCVFCAKPHSVTVNSFEFLMYTRQHCHEKNIQDVLKSATADEREFILSGVCPACFPKEEEEEEEEEEEIEKE